MGVLIITHYQRILHLVQPSHVHVMYQGRIVKEGGPELVTVLEEKGYGWIKDEVEAGGRRLMAAAADLDAAAVAAQFPILRAIDGGRIVYLDSGATAQKPEAGAATRWTSPTALHNANIHRGVYTLAQEATERFEGARERIARFVGAPTARDDLHEERRPRRSTSSRTRGAARTSARATAIVLTPMEHHANIVPWQLLAPGGRRELAYVELTDDGRLDLDSLDALLARGRSSSRSRTSRTCSARSTRSTRSSRARTPPARSCWSTARRRCRTCGSTCARSAPTSTASPATRSTARPASACCTGGASCWRRCRRSSAAAT